MVINRAELLSVALNMVKLNIVMNVKVIHVKNIGILINMIPFITHKRQKADLKMIQDIGVEQYNLQQREKMQILSHLLANYNDGRRKNFFCVAVNLLELSELQEAMKQIQQNDELSVLSVKEQCSYIVDILQKIADRRNIELKLVKK